MKTHFSTFIILLFLDFSLAQSLFVNAIEFKGQSQEQVFKGSDFNINFENSNFIVSQHDDDNTEFVIKRKNDSIQDIVFSTNRSAIAVAMRATDSRNRGRSIVTIDVHGKQTSFEYEAYKMTDRLGWIVELGAVSDDGNYILAKCALMLPENDAGVSFVRHEWTILEISDTAINVIDSINAINKWHDYARTGDMP
jgi:hypothetical protein